MISEPVPEALVWAIFFLPLGSFAAIALTHRRVPAAAAGYLTVAAIATAFGLAVYTLTQVIGVDGRPAGFETHDLFSAGSLTVHLGARLDGLSAVMLVVVTGVSLMIQVYSLGYMRGDHGFARYFAFMSLFTTAMLGLVLADNLIMLFVFWEMVGLTSYLLIGFWFHRPAAAAAAKKAFIVTRFGDLGFLAAILLIWDQAGTLNIAEINDGVVAAVGLGLFGQTTLTLFALGLVAGAIGKSAQFPLHIWLPDAMEGPTPVSGLVHSATMVAAGVYLLARFFPVLEASQFAGDFIAWIGAVTAVGAALLALSQVDIKRVLAYSTISQLAYMMFALGTGAYAAAVFHLVTHAFFKALLFMGAGSVHHATNTFDMTRMGGLRRAMPLTYATFLIGALSLSGIIPFAGFWSKDEILIDLWDHNKALFAVALAAVGLTALYIFRAIFLTFHGDYRGGEAVAPGEHGNDDPAHPHESPRPMIVPMLVLAVMAIIAGFLTIDGEIQGWLLNSLPHPEESEFLWKTGIFVGSTLVALAGLAAAVLLYHRKTIDVVAIRESRLVRPLHTLTTKKFYMDVLAEDLIVGRLFYGGLARFSAALDDNLVDGAVNGVARFTFDLGRWGRRVQNGQLQTAGVMLVAGGALIFGVVVIF